MIWFLFQTVSKVKWFLKSVIGQISVYFIPYNIRRLVLKILQVSMILQSQKYNV